MKRIALITIIACILSLGLHEKTWGFFTWVSTSMNGDSYWIDFELAGSEIQSILLILPNQKRMSINNTLGLNSFNLTAEDMSYEDLIEKFPEGEYRIVYLLPDGQRVRRKFTLSCAFPNEPTIIYPTDGATNVPTNLTIQWGPPSGNNARILDLWGGNGHWGGSYYLDLPGDFTSTTLALHPNTTYDMTLCGDIALGDPFNDVGKGLKNCKTIYFTTGN